MFDDKYRQYRFTLNTNDGYNVGFANKYTWRLNMGNIIEQNSRVMMSIEKINYSYTEETDVGQHPSKSSEAAGDDFDDIVYLKELNNRIEQLQQIMITQNAMKQSFFEIRCLNVNSKYTYDSSRERNEPLIYTGPLDFVNTNPKECFVYEVDKDICNSQFTLYITDWQGDRLDYHLRNISLSFVLHEYRE